MKARDRAFGMVISRSTDDVLCTFTIDTFYATYLGTCRQPFLLPHHQTHNTHRTTSLDMRVITLLLTLALAIGIHAAAVPSLLDSDLATIPHVDFAPADYNGTASAGDNVADFPGQYKFLDGTTQNLLEAGEFCNYMTYEQGQWKGYLGKWNGARVIEGFICYL